MTEKSNLNAAAAAFYYLRCVVYMFMREPAADIPVSTHGVLVRGGLLVATVMTIALGVLPNWPIPILDAAGEAAKAVAQLGGLAVR